MLKSLLLLCVAFATTARVGYTQATATVRVETANLQGPRPLQEQTRTAVISDYLQSWEAFSAAFAQNRADLLDPDFVGTARETLANSIQQQAKLGIHARYQERAHDIQIVFYSPDGLSIEMTDAVKYDVQLIEHDRVKTTQHVSARYIIILTPAEVRWRVRVLQAEPE